MYRSTEVEKEKLKMEHKRFHETCHGPVYVHKLQQERQYAIMQVNRTRERVEELEELLDEEVRKQEEKEKAMRGLKKTMDMSTRNCDRLVFEKKVLQNRLDNIQEERDGIRDRLEGSEDDLQWLKEGLDKAHRKEIWLWHEAHRVRNQRNDADHDAGKWKKVAKRAEYLVEGMRQEFRKEWVMFEKVVEEKERRLDRLERGVKGLKWELLKRKRVDGEVDREMMKELERERVKRRRVGVIVID